MIAFGPDPALPLPGSPSRGPRACPGPLLVAEGVGGGVVGLWGGIIVASISAGGVGDEELGVSVSDVALQGLMQPPLAGSVDQVDPGGVEPTEPALERAGAGEVVGEGQVQDLQVVLADESDLPTSQVGDVDLEGDVLVVPDGRTLSSREAPQRGGEEVAVLLEEVGDLVALPLAEGRPLICEDDAEAMRLPWMAARCPAGQPAMRSSSSRHQRKLLGISTQRPSAAQLRLPGGWIWS